MSGDHDAGTRMECGERGREKNFSSGHAKARHDKRMGMCESGEERCMNHDLLTRSVENRTFLMCALLLSSESAGVGSHEEREKRGRKKAIGDFT